ncbi:MAG: S8 family serine peptidase [Candidatus Thorarchaeota archaeon]
MRITTKKFFVLLFVMFLITSFGHVSAAQNPFRGITTTTDGHPTWDSDMINIEQVEETGKGVYVAVLDTGLVPNWMDYFPEERIATEFGIGFYQPVTIRPDGSDFEVGELHTTTYIGSVGSTHGTHVTSTIIGYFYDANADTFGGWPLDPLIVRGIAPDVTIIPVKVLADYTFPGLGAGLGQKIVFGTDSMVAAGIDYITDLKLSGALGDSPVVISMSLGGPSLSPVEKNAIDNAIANGVIVVAAAGNEGTDGMSFPGAYAPVISAGASGWTKEWLLPDDGPFYRLWWLQENPYGWNDIPEPAPVDEVYVTNFSSRELPGQELDVLAPGSWVRGPFPGFPGYSHLPWWSEGIGDFAGLNPGNFYYVGGTSMATPHVSAVAALMLEKNPTLNQADIESILKSTALPIPAPDSRSGVFVPFAPFFVTFAWDTDATGAGLIMADAALAAIP